MQNMFHVKIAKVQYFFAEVLDSDFSPREWYARKESIGHTFCMFYLSSLLLAAVAGCWAVTQTQAFGSSKMSTNLIGDDGKQLTSSCKWKRQVEIIRMEKHLRRAFFYWFMETIEKVKMFISCSPRSRAIIKRDLNVEAPSRWLPTVATHFQTWAMFSLFSFFLISNYRWTDSISSLKRLTEVFFVLRSCKETSHLQIINPNLSIASRCFRFSFSRSPHPCHHKKYRKAPQQQKSIILVSWKSEKESKQRT